MLVIPNMNEMHKLDLNLLRLFHYVYEAGSVSHAAEQLGITQSAASHGLRRLREILSDPLFVRSGHMLAPTARATSLAPKVSEAFQLLQSGLAETGGFDPATHKERFLLAMTDYVESLVLPKISAELPNIAPHVSIKAAEIGEGSLQEKGRIFDLMIARLDSELPPDFFAQVLWEERFVTVCAEDHPRIGTKLTLDAFLAEKHAIVGTKRQSLGAVDQALADKGLTRDVQVWTGFFQSPVRLAATSELLATVPERLVRQAASELPIKILEPPLTLKPFAISMCWSARRHHDPAHRWFRAWLKELAAGL